MKNIYFHIADPILILSMNRECALEQKLLARSHTAEEVDEIIADRYGIQGQSIIFAQSGVADPPVSLVKPKKQSIPPSTRKVVRLYIQQTTLRQRSLLKLLQKHRKRRDPFPFPLQELLRKYQIPDFTDFKHMHHMWQAYMQDLLFGGHAVPSLTMAARLATADFTGCIVTVVRSRDVNLVGVRGIVLWDAQLAFVLCVPRGEDAREWLNNGQPGVDYAVSPSLEVGGLRSIPKRKTVFSFDVQLPVKSDQKNKRSDTRLTPKVEAGKNTGLSTSIQSEVGGEGNHTGIDKEQAKDVDMGIDVEEQAREDELDPQVMTFSIIGLRFEIRLADRLGRKFKNHNIDDIY